MGPQQNPKDYSNYLKMAKKLALWTFGIGTLVFLVFYFFRGDITKLIGIFYLGVFGLFNIAVLIFLVILTMVSVKSKSKLKPLLQSVLVLLINLPIGLLYSQLLFKNIF